eukprot:gene22917-biopygen19286
MLLWGVGGQAARRGVAGGGSVSFAMFSPSGANLMGICRVVLQFAPPRVRAPGAQMIRLASGSSLAFQRLSRRSGTRTRTYTRSVWCGNPCRIASHRVASHRTVSPHFASYLNASHSIASHRAASHRIATYLILPLSNVPHRSAPHRAAPHRIAPPSIAHLRIALRRTTSHRTVSLRIACTPLPASRQRPARAPPAPRPRHASATPVLVGKIGAGTAPLIEELCHPQMLLQMQIPEDPHICGGPPQPMRCVAVVPLPAYCGLGLCISRSTTRSVSLSTASQSLNQSVSVNQSRSVSLNRSVSDSQSASQSVSLSLVSQSVSQSVSPPVSPCVSQSVGPLASQSGNLTTSQST